MRTPNASLLALPLALAACGGPDPIAPIDGEPPAAACRFDGVQASPVVGASPVHRATPVELQWAGAIDAIDIEVRADGAPVKGEVLLGATSAVFVPHALYPVDSRVEWRATACGDVHEGWFGVGALAHPLVDVGALVGGAPFEVDLRAAHLEAPSPNDPLAEVLLRFHLAPAFLVTFAHVEEGQATVLLAPAFVADDGSVRQDMSRPMAIAKVPLEGNPYLFLPRTDLELALGTGAATLRGADLVLGLDAARLEDGRLVAELDLREVAFTDGEEPCDVVARLSDDACRPCADGVPSCVPLVMHDIVGVSSSHGLDVPPLGGGHLP
ncbi:MAG: hypothetical protein IT383_25420 [Deltaproteobacteria bacterium]|nr:hypothetical protein [Deltaproteobacteria bacterium]